MVAVVEWVRQKGHHYAYQFGLHCATHQVRVILISGIVITSLFYPALDLYTSQNSLSVYEALFTSNLALKGAVPQDLANLWSAHTALHVRDNPVARAKCRDGQALRVERVFIQSAGEEDEAGALSTRMLLATLDLEQRLSSNSNGCLKNVHGRCLALSPLAYWGNDKETLLSDMDLLDTVSFANLSIAGGIPINPSMVLAARGSYDHHVPVSRTLRFDYADVLALTYFFPESRCWTEDTDSGHEQWLKAVRAAAAATSASGSPDGHGHGVQLTQHTGESSLIALEYDPHQSAKKGWTVMSTSIYLAYIGFFAYIAWSARSMDAVHSRLGVTFTALVEIAVSTITSLSVCALVGFKVTLVPWELLPIVIVFVGAENMSNIVNAVGKTSVTLSVKQRIAEGLSHAGTSNTLKVVSYNIILGVIAGLSGKSNAAVRQFCVFAIVVLVAHWFLAHTFFLAVLSIDIARLELDELLRHDASLLTPSPLAMKGNGSNNQKAPRSKWQRLVMTVQKSLRGRAATNISLLMLLGIAGTLYYTTYTTTHSAHDHTRIRATPARTRNRPQSTTLPAAPVSAPELIWKTLNTAQTPQLHLVLESPVTITFALDDVAHGDDVSSSSADGIASTSTSTSTSTPHRSRSVRTFRFMLWLLTIMVVPIGLTTGVLYGLLLYLLKDTELLEAQRHSGDGLGTSFGEKGGDVDKLETTMAFSTLPRAFSSDVELISASADGKIVVSVGLHNEISVWNEERRKMTVDEAPCSSYGIENIVCVSVDEFGKHFAVGTRSGGLVLWTVDRVGGGRVLAGPAFSLPASGTVREITFVPPCKPRPSRTPTISEPDLPKFLAGTPSTTMLVVYETGVVARWKITNHVPSVTVIGPSSTSLAVHRAQLLHVLPDDRVLVGFCLEDGSVEVIDTGDYEPTLLNPTILQAGSPLDAVTVLHGCRVRIGGGMRFVVGAATASGVVSLWDGVSGECIFVLEDVYGPVGRLNVVPSSSGDVCRKCRQVFGDSVTLAFSVESVVKLAVLYLEEGKRRCLCGGGVAGGFGRSVFHRRSRSSSASTASSVTSSPRLPRARLSTTFETSSTISSSSSSTNIASLAAATAVISSSPSAPSAFPVSGHGIHQRRASEKEKAEGGGTSRRSSEYLQIPLFPPNGEDPDGLFYPAYDRSGSATPTTIINTALGTTMGACWRTAVVVMRGEVHCERGGWCVSRGSVVGVRRTGRKSGKTSDMMKMKEVPGLGLSQATMERWEVWLYDPLSGSVSMNGVAGLVSGCDDSTLTTTSSPRSSISSVTSTSSSSSTSTVGAIPRLPFTRVSPVVVCPSAMFAGFGNTVGVFGSVNGEGRTP